MRRMGGGASGGGGVFSVGKSKAKLYEKAYRIVTHFESITNKKEGVSKLIHSLFFAQSPDFLKPGLCYFLKFLYL